MRIVIFSDTHGSHQNVVIPECDIAIFCGDYSYLPVESAAVSFGKWFSAQDQAKNKVLIAGNHDVPEYAIQENFPNCHYLQDTSVEIEGFKIYGSPWTPKFFDWYFMRERGEDIRQEWNKMIVSNNKKQIDILVTHGPSAGLSTLGAALDFNSIGMPSGAGMVDTGCRDLSEVISTIRPTIHCFGHIHEGYGGFLKPATQVMHVNASSVNSSDLFISNPPVVLDLVQGATPIFLNDHEVDGSKWRIFS